MLERLREKFKEMRVYGKGFPKFIILDPDSRIQLIRELRKTKFPDSKLEQLNRIFGVEIIDKRDVIIL